MKKIVRYLLVICLCVFLNSPITSANNYPVDLQTQTQQIKTPGFKAKLRAIAVFGIIWIQCNIPTIHPHDGSGANMNDAGIPTCICGHY